MTTYCWTDLICTHSIVCEPVECVPKGDIELPLNSLYHAVMPTLVCVQQVWAIFFRSELVAAKEFIPWCPFHNHSPKNCSCHVYVPRNLGICAILRLRCAFLESENCAPISRLRSTSAQSRDCAAPVRNLEIAQFL